MNRAKAIAGALMAASIILTATVIVLEPTDASEEAHGNPVFKTGNTVSDDCGNTLFVSAYHGTSGILKYVHNGVTTDIAFCSIITMCEGDYIVIDTGAPLSKMDIYLNTIEADVPVTGGTAHAVIETTFTDGDDERIDPEYSYVDGSVRIGFPTDSFLRMNFCMEYSSTVTYNSNSADARMGILDHATADENGFLQVTTAFDAGSDYVFIMDGSTICSWNSERDGTGNGYGLLDPIPNGTTVYAQWC